MSELRFPSTIVSPSWPLTEDHEDTSIVSKFEDGSMVSRSKFTRSRRKWILKWNNIEQSDYLEIMDFVVNKAKFAANIFVWTNIDTVEEVRVRITSVGKWTNEHLKFWSGELELTEV